MAKRAREVTLGGELRQARNARGLSLQQLAVRVQKTQAYLSDIELNRRIPAETVMADLARELEFDLDRLMALGARLGADTEAYLKEHPLAVEVVRAMARTELNDDQLRELKAHVEAHPAATSAQPAS